MRYYFDIPDDKISRDAFMACLRVGNRVDIKMSNSASVSVQLTPVPAEPEKEISDEQIITSFSIEDFKCLKEIVTNFPKLQQQNSELSERIERLEKYNDLASKEWRELASEKPIHQNRHGGFIPKEAKPFIDFSSNLLKEFIQKIGRYPTSEEIKELGEKGSVKVEHPPLPEPKLLTYEGWNGKTKCLCVKEGLGEYKHEETQRMLAVEYMRYLVNATGRIVMSTYPKISVNTFGENQFYELLGDRRQIIENLFVTS